MTEDFEKLIEQFEQVSIDGVLNFYVRNAHEECVIVQFSRSKTKQPWTVQIDGVADETRRSVSRAKLRQVLDAMGVSWQTLAQELRNALLLQAAYCDQFIREIREICGEHAVQQAILNTQSFMDELAESVNKTLTASPTDDDTSNSLQKASDLRSRLRIIPGK